MKVVSSLTKRNIKLFFRDRTSVFFSLLAVLIIFGLFVLFLGNSMSRSFNDVLGTYSRFIIDSWLMAGIISVTAITATMGAFGIMVEDRTKKIYKDFSSAPIKHSQLVGGYIFSSFIIGFIMSLAALIIAEIYIMVNGGSMLGIMSFLKLFGVMLISTFAATSMVFFIVTFFKSNSGFSAASTVIGTLIGFLTGIYIPVGRLPESIQNVIKIFPVSHSAALFRQIMMESPMNSVFRSAPVSAVSDFKDIMGVTFSFGSIEFTPFMHILVLVITGIIFYILAIKRVSIKR